MARTILVYSPWHKGGHPEYVYKLLDGLSSANGMEFKIVWPVRRDLAKRYIDCRFFQPRVIPSMSVGRGKWSTLAHRLAFWRRHDLGFLFWLFRIDVSKDSVVLVEEVHRFSLPLFVLASRLLGMRLVVHVHNVRRHDYRHSLVDRLDLRATTFGLSHADLVLVHSESQRSRLLADGIDSSRCRVLVHGIDPIVRSVPLSHAIRSRFLFFGVNRPNKGLDFLIDCLVTSGLGDRVELRVAGETDDDVWHSRSASKLSSLSRVQWIDRFIEPWEVALLLEDVDCVVLPYSSFEAQSGVLHLAIEHAVPVVVSDVGAMGALVREHQCGLVFAPGDTQGAVSALESMLDLSANRKFREGAVTAQSGRTWSDVGVRLSSLLSDL